MKAAIFHGPHQPLSIEDVDIDAPDEHEVVVRVMASGVCHSDLHYIDGLYDVPAPAILGHEASGIVEQVGTGVRDFQPGDHVIACLSAFCGQCNYCLTGKTHLCSSQLGRAKDASPKLSWRGQAVTQFANLSAFAERMLVHPNAIVKVRDDIPFDRAALIGCGVTAGMGAALQTARVEPGSIAAVFGCGAVGLSIIQGARIAGARMLIAVDVKGCKLAMATEMGATHTIDASSDDPVEAIMRLTGTGVDYSFEAVGLKATAEQSFECLRSGGTATIVGMLPKGQKIELTGSKFLRERKIQGSGMGSNRFKVDIPRYVDYYMQGRLQLDAMITRRLQLDEVNEAFRAMKAGEVVRSVVLFD